jgi:hypothetical protein
MVDCACRNVVVFPLPVTPATTGHPVRLHVARLSFVNLKYPPACPPSAPVLVRAIFSCDAPQAVTLPAVVLPVVVAVLT